ncbi:MAG: hypothetical protein HOI23_18230 [Deltaproteobacteria bacterium]|nr:hypothetical protein [Deltaproteobacteria bacterium]
MRNRTLYMFTFLLVSFCAVVGCEGTADNDALVDCRCVDTSFAGDFVSIHGFTAVSYPGG